MSDLIPFISKVPDSRTKYHSKKKASAPKKAANFPNKPSKEQKIPKIRLFLVWLALLLGCIALGWKLYQLQVIQGGELQEKARRQQTTNIQPYIPRRSIVDSQGSVLASDRIVYSVYLHPKYFHEDRSKEEIATQLANILSNITSQELLAKINQRDTGILLSNAISEETAERIRELNLGGAAELNKYYSRFYPQQKMMSETIGYVDRDYKGQAGVERSQSKLLTRDRLTLSIRSDRNGTVIPAYLPDNILNYERLRLQLTLDLRLQRAARNALVRQLGKYRAERGAVIVMDAFDGSLLALSCEPGYDPNHYYQNANVELFKNWTVSDLYEPGSTFKPLNLAIALEAGVINPNSHFYDSGSITVDGWKIENATKEKHGSLGLAEVLQTSSNIAMVQIINLLDRQNYYNSLKKLGLGEKVGIDLPGDIAGHLKNKKEFTSRAIEPATASFGQGFSLTPMKLIQLHAAIANGGKLVTPHVVRGLSDSQGQLHWQPTFKTKKIFSPQTSQEVLKMMETVVTKGTGKTARIPNYRLAGKTGTAQKASPGGGYIPGAKITSFVSILPVDSPRYVVLVLVDNPQGENTFGSTVAAPVAKSVIEALISLKEIPPSQRLN
jgi:cell division protein FtsI (penicillin-binding protein 3)